MLTRKAEIIAPITFVPTARIRSSRLKYRIGTSTDANSKTRRFTRVITFYRWIRFSSRSPLRREDADERYT